jgi:uncharacterized repeat protein (TIGR02543 family)
MKEKTLFSLLAFFCLVSGSSWAQTFTQGNLTYTVTDADAKTVSVAKASNDIEGAIVLPSTVTNEGVTYSVTETAAGAFHGCTGITAMTVPASVTTIKRGFLTGCTGLKTLTIKDSQTPISFLNNWDVYRSGNDQLCVADLDYYYQGRDIEAVEINKNIVTSAKKIVLGGKMTTIPGWFSDENKALTELTIGGNITYIGREAFDQNTSLSSVTITAPVERMQQSCFWGCSSLTAIELPATVKYMGPAVFRNCTALEALTIPAATDTITRCIISECTSLKKFTIKDNDKPLVFLNGWNNYNVYGTRYELSFASVLDEYYQGRDIVRDDPSTYKIVTSAKKITLGGGMTEVPNYFTQSDTALTTLVIGGNITKIGVEAFDSNTRLSNVTITAPVERMLQSCFWGCTALKNFTIPATVKYMGPAVFRKCSALEALTIPAATDTITRCIISECTSLKNFTIKDSDKPLVFLNGWSNYNVYGTRYELSFASVLDEYYQGRDIVRDDPSTYNIVTSATKITLGGSMTEVPNYFTENDTALTEVIIGGNITKIGYVAFNGNKRLSTVTFNAPVDSISQSAFYGCPALESIELPQTLKYLGPAVFRNCTALTALTIPAATEHINRSLVMGCSALKTFTIEDSDKPLFFHNEWDSYPVYSTNEQLCVADLDYFYMGRDVDRTEPNNILVTSAKKIKVAGTVTAIPNYFTKDDKALTEVTLQGNMTKIGNQAFMGCSNLVTFNIDAPIDTIRSEAFYGCASLPAITMPKEMKRIEAGTFRDCVALEAFTIPAATEYVGRAVFWWCSSLKKLTIEDSDTPLFFQNEWNAYPVYSSNEQLCVADLDEFYMGRDVDRTEPEKILITSAKKIDVAGSVTAIPNYFTKDDKALTEVTLQGNMTKIGYQAFMGCSNLATFSIDAPIDTIRYEAFYGCSSLPTIAMPKEMKRIEAATFRNCTALEAFTIPAATECVGRSIFWGCSGLKKLTIEDSSTPLFFQNGWNTYGVYGSSNELCVADVEELYVGRDVTVEDATRLVSKTQKLAFGQPVTTLGASLYNTIAGITEVRAPWQSPIAIPSNAFSTTTYQNATLLVPGGKKQAYAAAEGWKNFTKVDVWSVIVTLKASAHGTIATEYGTAEAGQTVQFNLPKDEPLVYTLSADNGYKLSALTDNGTAVSPLPQLGTAQSRAIADGEETITLSATFAPVSYTLTYDLAGGKMASGVTNPSTYTIETATFTLKNPTRDHYDFTGWTGTDLSAPTQTVTIAKGSTGDRSYTATWAPATYTVTISGAGVTASNYAPKYGESVTITIEDDPDRTLVSLLVNGQDVTAQVVGGQYVIQNVSGNVTVEATFRSTKEFITMTGDYATFSCPQDLDFTGSELRAYIASGFNKATNQVLLTRVKDVPAGTGVFLVGTPGETYKIPYAETTSYYVNLFVANLQRSTLGATTGNFSNFIFGEQAGDPGFYPIEGRTTLLAQTAYLQLPTSFVAAGVKVSVVFEEDIIDGMFDMSEWSDLSDESAQIYDLAGRRLGKTQRGINIVNGKKKLVK